MGFLTLRTRLDRVNFVLSTVNRENAEYFYAMCGDFSSKNLLALAFDFKLI